MTLAGRVFLHFWASKGDWFQLHGGLDAVPPTALFLAFLHFWHAAEWIKLE